MYIPALKQTYKNEVIKALSSEFNYKNVMQIPKLDKIIISMGVGRAVQDKKNINFALSDITLIAGQKAVATKAKNSISNFKLRKGMPIGAKVTLRGDNMYEFLYKFINIALPRVKDFRGINPNGFDGHGNYSVGITEQIVFPEIEYDKIDKITGMNICIVTTAKTDQEAKTLLEKLGAPFKKR